MAPLLFETLTFNIISEARKDHLKNHSASSIKYALYPKAWRVLAKLMTFNVIQPYFEKIRAINTILVAFNTRGQHAYAPPPSSLPSSSKKGGLAKHLLSCHPQEGCLAAEKIRERGERREKSKT